MNVTAQGGGRKYTCERFLPEFETLKFDNRRPDRPTEHRDPPRRPPDHGRRDGPSSPGPLRVGVGSDQETARRRPKLRPKRRPKRRLRGGGRSAARRIGARTAEGDDVDDCQGRPLLPPQPLAQDGQVSGLRVGGAPTEGLQPGVRQQGQRGQRRRRRLPRAPAPAARGGSSSPPRTGAKFLGSPRGAERHGPLPPRGG